MVYFVTGATGFLGRHVVAALRAADPGALIRCLIRRQGVAPAAANIELVVGDLHDAAALQQGLKGADVVLHFAGATRADDPALYQRVNVEGTAALITAAKHAGVRRVVFASSRAIGERCGPYGASKRQAEQLILDSRLPYVILRFAELYGPDASEGMAAFARLVRRLPVIHVVRGATVAPVEITDAVQVVLASLKDGAMEGGIYTIAGPHSYRVEECARMIAAALQVRRLYVPLPARALRALVALGRLVRWKGVVADQVDRLLCAKETDIGAAVQRLGFRPRSFSECVQQWVAVRRAHGA